MSAEAALRACLARIDAREAVVGAWKLLDRERALAAARAADSAPAVGAMHGVPIGVKDIIDTFDLPTGLGFAPYASRQPVWDAACVAACRKAGAIVLGKTVTTEFAYFTAGRTRNPHDLSATPGGSSSGSAAAVADGMVPLAFGTQTAASVIRPAAYCGVVGYKASHGRFSLSGIRPFAESHDSLGVLARNVDDVARMCRVLAMDPGPSAALAPLEGPRLGLCRTPHWERLEAAAADSVLRTAEVLASAGARVEPIALPSSFDSLADDHRTVMAFEAARNYAFECERHASALSDAFRTLCAEGVRIARTAYEASQARIGAARQVFAALFAGFDAWIAPSALGEAPPAERGTGDPLLSRSWTALHAPALALPTGRGPRGLPLGIQLVALQGGDERLLAVGAWCEPRICPPWTLPMPR